jgi:ankyrin repeat protein
MFLAAYLGHLECIKVLLAEGADLLKPDAKLGWTPLHSSISVKSIFLYIFVESFFDFKELATVKQLLEGKEKQLIDVPSRVYQQTPLMLASDLDANTIVEISFYF